MSASHAFIRCDCGWKSVYRVRNDENELRTRCIQEYEHHATHCVWAAESIERRKQKQGIDR